MPKKRSVPKIDHINARSSRIATSASLQSVTSSRTVNERLAQLRIEQTPLPTVEKRREIERVATSKSMPPNLSSILDIPETGPPLPRPSSRRLQGILRRAPPGPATPKSWLAASFHAPTYLRARAIDRQRRHDGSIGAIRDRPAHICRLSKVEGFHKMPKDPSLIHQALKAIALGWDLVIYIEQFNLAALPVAFKSILLTYISVYGPDEGICLNDLKILFLTEEEIEGGTGCEEISRLDMTGLISSRLTIAELCQYMFSRSCRTLDAAESVNLATSCSTSVQLSESTTVLESWEQGLDTCDITLPSSITFRRFPNLTRLSLANAGSHASWNQFLKLSAHLSTLTHLSLAYWPIPTMAPSSKTVREESSTTPYSPSPPDDDHQRYETANILRRVSNNMYSLQWIDLEGCNEWLPALTWSSTDSQAEPWPDVMGNAGNEVPTTHGNASNVVRGPDWNGAWSQVRYVNVSQGWIPDNTAAVRAMPAGVIACDLLLWLRENKKHARNGKLELNDFNLPSWLRREKEARVVASTVRQLRNSMKGDYCSFDHGWVSPRTASAKEKKDDAVD